MLLTKEMILTQEKEWILPSFTIKDAEVLGSFVKKVASENLEKITIEISHGNRLVYLRAGNETGYENDYLAGLKRNVTVHHHHSSMYMRLLYEANAEAYLIENGLSQLEYSILGGAFPIFVESVGFVGTIAVSGMPMIQDHGICYEGLKLYAASLSK